MWQKSWAPRFLPLRLRWLWGRGFWGPSLEGGLWLLRLYGKIVPGLYDFGKLKSNQVG